MKKTISLIIVCAILASFCVINAGAQSEGISNIITNGDFSDGDTGWALRVAVEGASFSISETGGIDGSKCAYVDKAQGAGDLLLPISMSGFKAGDVLKFSAKVKLAGNCPNGKTTSTAKWLGNNALLDTTGVTVPVGEWTEVSYTTALTDELLSSGKFALRVSHPGNADNYNGGYYMDDVVVLKYETDPDNLVFNHNFNYGTEGWDVRNTSYADAATITAQSTGGADDSACMKISKTSYLGDVRQWVPVEEGSKYYLSAKIKMEATAATNARLLFYYNGQSTPVIISQNNAVGTDGYTTIGGAFTVPVNGSVKSEIVIRASNNDFGAAFIDDVVMISGDVIGIDGIEVNGNSIAEFDKTEKEYVYKLPYGTTEIPTVTAAVKELAADFKTTYTVENVTLEGATVVATSPDGSESETYTIRFEMMEQITLGDVSFSGDFATNSVVTASLPITNNSLETLSSGLNVVLVVGLYDSNGTMKDIGFTEAKNVDGFSIAPGETENLTVPLTISDAGCTLSAHVIDGFATAAPLSGMWHY